MPIFNNGQMGLMPGELNGIPNGYGIGSDYGQGGFGGLLSGDNQLLNVGLGILANNHGNYGSFSAAIGKGVQQGIQQNQQAKQLSQQKQLRDLQMQQEQQKMEEYRAQQDALKDFDIKHPEYAGLARLDPKSALKIAYPQLAASSADPYYQFLPTANGYASGNARTGQVQMVLDAQGRPIVKASDSPYLQGRIAGAKEAAQADYKVNTSIPGQIMTDRQVAEQANPMLRQSPTGLPPQSLPQLPQANVQGNFNGNPQAILSQINRISDPQERANALQAFQQQYGQMQPALQQQLPAPVSNNLVGGGIRVPTPAEQAALTETAKKTAENNANMAMDKVKNVKKSDQFLSVAQQAKQILNSKENPPTSSGIGAMVDSAGNLIGMAPKGAETAAQLEAISGWMVSNVPRMEGPQSNFDVQNYQTMAGMVGDRTKPLSVRRGALDQVIKLQEKYKALNQDGIQTPQTTEQPSGQPTVRKYNPKTGRIE